MIIRNNCNNKSELIKILHDFNVRIKRMRMEDIDEPFYLRKSFKTKYEFERIRDLILDYLPEQYSESVKRYPDYSWSSICIPVFAKTNFGEGEDVYLLSKEEHRKCLCETPIECLKFSLPDFKMSLEIIDVPISDYSFEYCDIDGEVSVSAQDPHPLGVNTIEVQLTNLEVLAIYEAMGVTPEELKEEFFDYIRMQYPDATYESVFTFEGMIDSALNRQLLLNQLDYICLKNGHAPISLDYKEIDRIILIRTDNKIVINNSAYGIKDCFNYLVDIESGTMEKCLFVTYFGALQRIPLTMSEIDRYMNYIINKYGFRENEIKIVTRNISEYRCFADIVFAYDSTKPLTMAITVNIRKKDYSINPETLENMRYKSKDGVYMIPIRDIKIA